MAKITSLRKRFGGHFMYCLVMSDLHVGDPSSQWRDALKILKQHGSQMNVIVFAGDTYDLKYLNDISSPRIRHRVFSEMILFKYFLTELGLFNKSVFIQGNHDPSVTDKMYVKLATRTGRVIILHGHNLGAEHIAQRANWGGSTGEKIKEILVEEPELDWVPDLSSEDWLVMGHSHVSYFRTHKKVVGLGCWWGAYTNPSVGMYLMIDDRLDNKPYGLKNLLTLKRYIPHTHLQPIK